MHGFVSYRRFGKVRSLCSDRAVYVLGRYRPSHVRARSLRNDRAWLELGRYVATELGLCVVRWPYLSFSVADLDTCPLPSDNRSVVSGLLALLKVERDKIGAAPYDGCLRTLVEGIKPFVVRLGVKVLMTSFPARPLRSSLYVEVIRRVAADGILYGCRGKTTSCHLVI
ncbi:hypothetical protein F2Q69_00059344 [Brassica cretica]|uniref:Uncharacterized protein n=1 Tax=Brassica cretica TaxID=69181 RepID=A0A8S9RHT7_BRACR|nr:hypothetical protein F2Q69_00059344 [Brassica cretica]